MINPEIKPKQIKVILISALKNDIIQGTKIKVKERMETGKILGLIPQYTSRIAIYWKPNKSVFDKKSAKKAFKYTDWGNNKVESTNIWVRLKEDFTEYNNEIEKIKFERVISPKGQDKDEQIIAQVLNGFEETLFAPF